MDFFHKFLHDVQTNLFQPLLLFFYAGFLIPIFRVAFEFPYQVYQGLTLYLLIAIGWEGGEKLAKLDPAIFQNALGFMVVGFVLNFCIGCFAYFLLRKLTRLRQVDAATVAGYYGSDSAGTFVTCVAVLATQRIASAAFMPVMLAVMEIPGCLVALYLVSRMRASGMDSAGNMPHEPGYKAPQSARLESAAGHGAMEEVVVNGHGHAEEPLNVASQSGSVAVARAAHTTSHGGGHGSSGHEAHGGEHQHGHAGGKKKRQIAGLDLSLLHEVFLNPGLYLLFAGIAIGFISGKNMPHGAPHSLFEDVVSTTGLMFQHAPPPTHSQDLLFSELFKGILCLFLLEMGITASKRVRDLKTAGIGFILFGVLAPNVFGTIGIVVAHTYSSMTGVHFELGTYVLFAVLCAAASYIAVPAVQRLAIPEASPTLPLAASLGLTFSYNVTIGIQVYIIIAQTLLEQWPA